MMAYDVLTAKTATDLDRVVTRYLDRYHPAGYGTTIRRRWVEEAPESLLPTHKALVVRAESCG